MGRGLLLCFTTLLAVQGAADVLETRDGRILQGTYLGGTQQAVRFETGGSVQVLPRDEVLALTFVSGEAGPAADVAPPQPALARVPAGTRLQVRLVESIDARLATPGDTFETRLETGLGVDGRAIVPAGSVVEGRVAEVRNTGPTGHQLQLELSALILQGQRIELTSGSQGVAPAAAPPAAGDPGAALAASRPGVQAGTLLEFRLLQPVDLRLQ